MSAYSADQRRRMWLMDQLYDTEGMVSVTPIYREAGESLSVMHDDLTYLRDRGLIRAYFEGGGAADAELTGAGRDQVGEWRLAKDDRAARSWACRSALVVWLYARGAVDNLHSITWTEFVQDATRANYLGEPFTDREIDSTAGWLQREGLIEGISAFGNAGPIRSSLTNEGVACAEDGGDVRAWVSRRGQPATTGPTPAMGSSARNQSPDDNDSLGMALTDNPEQLVLVLKGLISAFREVMDDAEDLGQLEAEDLDELEAQALAGLDSEDVEPTKKLLGRITSVLRSGLKTGANVALASFVSWGAVALEQTIVHH